MDSGHALDTADAVSFDQCGNYATALINGQCVHAFIIRERLRVLSTLSSIRHDYVTPTRSVDNRAEVLASQV